MDETSLAPGHLVNQFSSGAWEPVVGSRRKILYMLCGDLAGVCETLIHQPK